MVTCEEAVTILAESKRQNEIMRDNPSVFFTHGDLKGPQNARKRIEALDMAIFELKGNSRRIELDYLLAFATESCFDTETCCDQLRSLWTAYCLHNRLDVDTRDYDLTLLKVWGKWSQPKKRTTHTGAPFDSFDDFMCSWLV